MSKKLSKVLMATLAVAFAFCMAIATLGVFTTKAAVSTGDIVMLDSAQVRQTGEMGIRFTATISESDYETLSAQGAEFGMILAPADWVENDDDLAFGSSALSLYDGTQGVGDKYFAQGINIPVQDVNDFDGDGDRAEYLLTCSFVKIKTTNFDRNFKARAYYKVDGEYYHSENVVERNIFTVASKAYADGEMEDEVVETYLAGIISEVAKEYTTVTATITGDDNGTIAKNGELSVTATVSNGSKTLDAGVQLFVTKSGDVVEDALSFNAQTGKYTVATAGKFTVVAKIGNTVVAEKELTVAREGEVTITLKPGKAVSTWKDIVALDNPNRITFSDLHVSDNKISSMGYNVVLMTEINDPENPDVTALNYENQFILDCDTNWLKLGKYGHLVYLCADNTKPIDPEATITAVYTDAYGIEYKASLPVYGNMYNADGSAIFEKAYFGQVENRFTATDALISDTRGGWSNNITTLFQWTTVRNVPLTSSNASDLIRFTLMSKVVDDLPNKMWKFIISESGNPDNWMSICFGRFPADNYVTVGMNTNAWSQSKLGYAYRVSSFNTLINEPDNSNGGWNFDTTTLAGTLYGKNPLATDPVNYVKEMIGFSIVNSEVFLNVGTPDGYVSFRNGESILPKSQQNNATYNITPWSGFDSLLAEGKTVDISFTATNTRTLNGQYIIIDTLGGQKVTADILDSVYYSYSDFPCLYAE